MDKEQKNLVSSSSAFDDTTITTTSKEQVDNEGEPQNFVDHNSTTTSNTVQKGVAGRINYAAWDQVAKDLVTQVDEDDQQEIQIQQQKLGLDGKYARSADEAMEREKAIKVQQTKRTIDQFKQRESNLIQNLSNLLQFQSSSSNNKNNEMKDDDDTDGMMSVNHQNDINTVRITRNHLDAGKRVVTISDVTGITPQRSIIVLTSDLSLLQSNMPINSNAKSFHDDAENTVVIDEDEKQDEQPQYRSIYGIIKVFLSNIQNCTILVKCKIITGTIELHNCQNIIIKIEKDATVATIQADLSSNIGIEFHDAVSGKHIPSQNPKNIIYWGDDKDDRIFHAGISNMDVSIYRDGYIESTIHCDYIQDGAEQIGNSTKEEFQFVISCHEGQLINERVVRAGNTTGKNVRAMTDREIQMEKEKRAHAAKCAIKMADDMIQIKDKDGNVLVKKTNINDTDNDVVVDTDETIEEVYASMSREEIDSIISECDQLKIRGNEAFGAGEYGQAILHYSLCLDKAHELPDMETTTTTTTTITDTEKKSLFPRDVVYSNRAAAFLKLGQHDKAEIDAKMALEINPSNIKANFRKGLALHASGKYQEALPVLANAYKMEPHNKQIQQALKFCEIRVEQDFRKRMAQN